MILNACQEQLERAAVDDLVALSGVTREQALAKLISSVGRTDVDDLLISVHVLRIDRLWAKYHQLPAHVPEQVIRAWRSRLDWIRYNIAHAIS